VSSEFFLRTVDNPSHFVTFRNADAARLLDMFSLLVGSEKGYYLRKTGSRRGKSSDKHGTADSPSLTSMTARHPATIVSDGMIPMASVFPSNILS
jgi:hypothetical protein